MFEANKHDLTDATRVFLARKANKNVHNHACIVLLSKFGTDADFEAAPSALNFEAKSVFLDDIFSRVYILVPFSR